MAATAPRNSHGPRPSRTDSPSTPVSTARASSPVWSRLDAIFALTWDTAGQLLVVLFTAVVVVRAARARQRTRRLGGLGRRGRFADLRLAHALVPDPHLDIVRLDLGRDHGSGRPHQRDVRGGTRGAGYRHKSEGVN